MQYLSAICLCFLPPLCIFPYLRGRCYERYHYCGECRGLLWKAVPFDLHESQWMDANYQIERELNEEAREEARIEG